MTSATKAQPSYVTSYGDDAAENYERYFVPVIGGPFGADLVEEAGLKPGERVLDVACGTGTIARLAAERVGNSGTIAGLDINPAMLSMARSLPAVAPIKWYETSAESIPLSDNSFDVVFCALGLQFITDKAATLRELRRVLVPGGRVYVNTPIPNPFFEVLHNEIARHVNLEAAAFMRAVFSLHEPRELSHLFAAAGFEDVRVRAHQKQLLLPPPRDFMWQYISCTPLLALLSQSASAQTAALERAVVAEWQPWANGKGMSHEQAVLVGSARRPQ